MIGRIARITLWLGVLLLTPQASAQEFERAAVRDYLETSMAEIEEMAAFFGWTGPVNVTDEGALDANAARISLNPEKLAQLVSGVKSFELRDAIRLVVAHEVWHHVEYKLGNLPLVVTDSDRRRVFECQADIMAARYVGSTGEYYQPSLSWSDVENIAAQLWQRSTPDHPTPAQREIAAQFGYLLALRDRPEVASSFKEQIDRRLDLGAAEPIPSWIDRTCRRIARVSTSAVNNLVISDPVKFMRDGSVMFRLSYANRSARTMDVEPLITARRYGSSVDGIDSTTRMEWSFAEKFTLAPGETLTIERPLEGLTDGDATVYFDTRNDDGKALIAARYVVAPIGKSAWSIAKGLSQEDVAMALALQSFCNDSMNGFAQFRGGNARFVGGGSTLVFDTTIQVPDSRGTSIFVKDDGASYVSATMTTYDESPDVAAAVMSRLVAQLRRIWPNATVVTDDGEFFALRVSRTAEIEVSLVRPSGNVFLSVHPRALGLADGPPPE